MANNAARLAGGNTMHAFLKLPFKSLREKRARLRGQTLQDFRREWELTRALFIVEFSMVGCEQVYQAEIRAKQAKNNYAEAWGGMAVCASGDLLQLPPVDKHSVAEPPPDRAANSLKSGEQTCTTPRSRRRNRIAKNMKVDP